MFKLLPNTVFKGVRLVHGFWYGCLWTSEANAVSGKICNLEDFGAVYVLPAPKRWGSLKKSFCSCHSAPSPKFAHLISAGVFINHSGKYLPVLLANSNAPLSASLPIAPDPYPHPSNPPTISPVGFLQLVPKRSSRLPPKYPNAFSPRKDPP